MKALVLASSSLATVVLCAWLSSCASSSSSVERGEPYDLRIDGNDVSLSFRCDVTVPEFLRLAQDVTSEVYVFRNDPALPRLAFVGQLRCARRDFPEFVATLLSTHGLRTETKHEDGLTFLEVVPVGRG